MIEEKWTQLKCTKADPAMIAWMKKVIESGSDFDCYKINAFVVANELEIERSTALRAFLYATKLGIFDLNWDIYCPSCHGLPEYHQHLMGIQQRSHCNLCQFDWEIDFHEQVEVSFTVNPEVRKIEYEDFHTRDFNSMMDFIHDLATRANRNFPAADCFFPDRTVEIQGKYEPGVYRAWVPEHVELEVEFEVTKTQARELQVVPASVDSMGAIHLEKDMLDTGDICFHVSAPNYPEMNGFLTFPKEGKKNWVSAFYVSSIQDFKDLFDGEFLNPECRFSIQSVTLLFTDVVSSTELYSKVGDSKAYSLIQKHFEIMQEVIAQFEGGIVKTIGDAVMASFPTSQLAIQASLEILRQFQKHKTELDGLEVKLGLHRGPTIVVSANDRNDFFGSTVNVAARTQGVARAQELVISKSLSQEDEISQTLNNNRAIAHREFQADFKGIEGKSELIAYKV